MSRHQQVAARRAPRRFAGWRILGLAVATGALTGPGQTIGVSVFVDQFIDALDLTRSQVASAYLIGTLTAAFGLPLVGTQIDTRGVKRSMTLIGVLFGMAAALMSGVQGFVTLTIGFVLIRLLGQGALMLVSTVAVTKWFEHRRGTALGVFSTGVSILMSLVPVALSLVIEAYDWRVAWMTAGLSIWVTVVPIARFGMIDEPAAVGQVPDGPWKAPQTVGSASPAAATRREAMRTLRFWTLVASTAAVGMLSTALNFHQIALLGDAGLSPTAAAAMFLPQTIGAAVAGLAVGYLSDHLTARSLIPLAMFLLAASLVLASRLSPGPVVVIYAITLGAAGGAARSVGATLLPRWFGVKHIGAIQGAASFVAVASTAMGPLAFSIARDSTGNFEQAALLYAVIPVIVALAALALRPVHQNGPVGES